MQASSPTQSSIFLRRIGAFVFDIIALFVVLAPLGWLVQRLIGAGTAAPTAVDVYTNLVFNFSVPAWTYFILADTVWGGATLGKRLLGLRTARRGANPIGVGRGLVRTAIKVLPWEIVHASSFLLVPALGVFTVWNAIGIGVAYVLWAIYLVVAWRTDGQRSVHDYAAATLVVRATPT